MVSLLALVLTSLIGMLGALSRLCYAAALDRILPERFAALNDKQIPVNAMLLVLLISVPIPFLGRTAIGWIVDITTIGATIIYGFVSVAVFKVSGREGSKRDRLLSGICLLIFIAFAFPQSLFRLYDRNGNLRAYRCLVAAWTFVFSQRHPKGQ